MLSHGLIVCPFFKPKQFLSMHHSNNWDNTRPVLVINKCQTKGHRTGFASLPLSVPLSLSLCYALSLSQSLTYSPFILLHSPMWLWEMSTNVYVCALNFLIWVCEGIYVLCVMELSRCSVTIYWTELWVFALFEPGCSGLNNSSPKRYISVLITRTYEYYLIWQEWILP